jgi:hypothetical protein
MTNEVLATHIGYLYELHKDYSIKLKTKLAYGLACDDLEKNFRNAFYGIQELERIYSGCSCFDGEICDFINYIKNLIS